MIELPCLPLPAGHGGQLDKRMQCHKQLKPHCRIDRGRGAKPLTSDPRAGMGCVLVLQRRRRHEKSREPRARKIETGIFLFVCRARQYELNVTPGPGLHARGLSNWRH